MSTTSSRLIYIVEYLVEEATKRRGGLGELEKLTIESIVKGITYQEACLKYGFTESSFQNAASRLFRELSPIVGTTLNRKNFEVGIEQAWEEIKKAERAEEMIFDRLQVLLWICENRAKLISLSYDAERLLDITSYLVDYSPQFAAAYCVDVGKKSSPLELLWNIGQTLQVAFPLPKNNPGKLLELITKALKKRKTLLVLRFDSFPLEQTGRSRAEYAEILTTIGLGEGQSCLMAIDNDPMTPEIQVQASLSYQLQGAIVSQTSSEAESKTALRLLSISQGEGSAKENDSQNICELLQTYIK